VSQLAAAEELPAYAVPPASPASSRKRRSISALTGGKVVGSDEAGELSVPAGCKLTDQQIMAEAAEVKRRHGHPQGALS